MKISEHTSSYIKVGIPINEGKVMFELRPINEYGPIHPMVALKDGWITKILTLDINVKGIKKSIQIWEDILDNYSSNLNEDIINYHIHLLKDIKDKIKHCGTGCVDLEKRVNGISTELCLVLGNIIRMN